MFEPVPLSIDFFISRPALTNAILSRAFAVAVLAAVLFSAYFVLVAKPARRRSRATVAAVVIILAALCVPLRAAAKRAYSPSAATIIAAIVKEKAVRLGPLGPERYFVTTIEGRDYGVIVNRDIYDMEMYRAGSTFDYSLYSYMSGDTPVLYRFLRPECKLPAERGNLQ